MKANELSVGDWVRILNYHWDGSPYVAQIDGIAKKHGTYYLQFGSALSAEIGRCEPIPLTDELLQKHFPTDDELVWWPTTIVDGKPYYYHFEYARVDWCVVVELKYAHELQHLLKLCGIKKEIEL